jgi:hypothetical protein
MNSTDSYYARADIWPCKLAMRSCRIFRSDRFRNKSTQPDKQTNASLVARTSGHGKRLEMVQHGPWTWSRGRPAHYSQSATHFRTYLIVSTAVPSVSPHRSLKSAGVMERGTMSMKLTNRGKHCTWASTNEACECLKCSLLRTPAALVLAPSGPSPSSSTPHPTMLLSECLRSWQSVPFILVLLLSSLISVDACECALGLSRCRGSLTENRAVPSDFIVNQPGSSTSWKNGSPYPVTWTLGLQDGINSFDIEITRLSRVGIYFVAKERKSPQFPS